MSSLRLRCINPAMLCLVMHSAGGILVWLSCIMSRGDICCTQEHDGDDLFYIREFHILMRHYVYYFEVVNWQVDWWKLVSIKRLISG